MIRFRVNQENEQKNGDKRTEILKTVKKRIK
jgi:hypothetical protein